MPAAPIGEYEIRQQEPKEARRKRQAQEDVRKQGLQQSGAEEKKPRIAMPEATVGGAAASASSPAAASGAPEIQVSKPGALRILAVFGLPLPWSREQVERYFLRYGTLISVRMGKKPKGGTQAALIKFQNQADAIQAVDSVHGAELEGKFLRCELRPEQAEARASSASAPPVPDAAPSARAVGSRDTGGADGGGAERSAEHIPSLVEARASQLRDALKKANKCGVDPELLASARAALEHEEGIRSHLQLDAGKGNAADTLDNQEPDSQRAPGADGVGVKLSDCPPGAKVRYWSQSLNRWATGTVVKHNPDGTLKLDIKRSASLRHVQPVLSGGKPVIRQGYVEADAPAGNLDQYPPDNPVPYEPEGTEVVRERKD